MDRWMDGWDLFIYLLLPFPLLLLVTPPLSEPSPPFARSTGQRPGGLFLPSTLQERLCDIAIPIRTLPLA